MEKVIIVYTDGGARGNGQEDCKSAWAYTLSYGQHYKEDAEACYGATNNQMEMTAIIKALEAIKNKAIPIRLHSDSAYCINGITSWIHNWKKKGWVNSKKEPVENKELADMFELDMEMVEKMQNERYILLETNIVPEDLGIAGKNPKEDKYEDEMEEYNKQKYNL